MTNNDDKWGVLGKNHKPAQPTAPAKKSKKGLVLASSLALAAVVGTGAVLGLSGGSDHEAVRPSVPVTTSASPTPTTPPGAPVPVKQDPWQANKWSGPTEKGISTSEKSWVKSKETSTLAGLKSTNALTPESAGFTSDVSKASVNGAPNPLFSYWTSDLFNTESALEVEALVNPVFGGWAAQQAPHANPSTLDPKTFGAIFTDAYLKRLQKQHRALPVLADWENNAYGNAGVVQQYGGGYWVGEVTGTTAKWTYDMTTLGYRVNATYKVRFTGVRADGSTVVKNGTLKLTFVPAPLSVAQAGGYRVLIDDASLEVK